MNNLLIFQLKEVICEQNLLLFFKHKLQTNHFWWLHLWQLSQIIYARVCLFFSSKRRSGILISICLCDSLSFLLVGWKLQSRQDGFVLRQRRTTCRSHERCNLWHCWWNRYWCRVFGLSFFLRDGRWVYLLVKWTW